MDCGFGLWCGDITGQESVFYWTALPWRGCRNSGVCMFLFLKTVNTYTKKLQCENHQTYNCLKVLHWASLGFYWILFGGWDCAIYETLDIQILDIVQTTDSSCNYGNNQNVYFKSHICPVYRSMFKVHHQHMWTKLLFLVKRRHFTKLYVIIVRWKDNANVPILDQLNIKMSTLTFEGFTLWDFLQKTENMTW